MKREHWTELTQAIQAVARRWKDNPHYEHPTHVIVSVYCWAAIHDRSVHWATQRENWIGSRRPPSLPDQSTMSRRTRKPDFRKFFDAVEQRLRQTAADASIAAASSATERSTTAAVPSTAEPASAEASPPQQPLMQQLKLDGKPIPVAGHSTDVNATFGRGAGMKARGYKLHAIWGDGPAGVLPLQWLVAPLNVCEKQMARRLLLRLAVSEWSRHSCGYLLADGYYDWSELFDLAAAANLQLLAPRQHAGTGLGHHYQSPHRKQCINMLENPTLNDFGNSLYRGRKQIERDFGNLSSFGGGLTGLPPWARRYWRVRNWVHAKLLINACRIICLRRRRETADA